MAEPSGITLACSGLSTAGVAALLRRIVRGLPRWKSSRIVYMVADPNGRPVREDVFCLETETGQRIMTTRLDVLEEYLDATGLTGRVLVVSWDGKVRIREIGRRESEVTT